jgi:hypothetical protein
MEQSELLENEEYIYLDEKVLLASSSDLTNEAFLTLAKSRQKEVLVALAKNPLLPKEVAFKLIGTVYLVHMALLDNPVLDDELKLSLLKHSEVNPILYHQLQERLS